MYSLCSVSCDGLGEEGGGGGVYIFKDSCSISVLRLLTCITSTIIIISFYHWFLHALLISPVNSLIFSSFSNNRKVNNEIFSCSIPISFLLSANDCSSTAFEPIPIITPLLTLYVM